MSPSPQLAPPGSSTYDSSTMHVGDGTWDAGRDDFLLPNLVGLNFNTMRYNGMGNRFYSMVNYQNLIRAHGIIAAIVFLGIVPLAIFLMRFYGRRPRHALRMHIWLQILTLFLSTVIIILGFIAVGPKRSLTNPHHGIGVAIYVIIWAQMIGGWLMHRSEKNKRRFHLPLKAMLHHWLGRAIALLAIAQVALGLTLYGSPLYLFVLYALFVFALLALYFILEWLAERRRSEFSEAGSYYTEEVVPPQGRSHVGLGKLAAAGVAGAGLAALFRRRSSRTQQSRPHATYGQGTETETGTSLSADTWEKDSAAPERRTGGGFMHKILPIAAVGGGIAAARKLFGGRRTDTTADGPYRPPLGGLHSVTTTDSMSRVEEGQAPNRPVTPLADSPGYVRPSHPLAQPPMTPGRHGSISEDSYYSYMSGSPSRKDRRHHPFRDALAAGGAVFAVRQLFKSRRQRKEDRRADELRRQRLEEERLSRMNGNQGLTGDGITPPRRTRLTRPGSQSASDVSSFISERPTYPPPGGPIPAVAAGALGGAAAGAFSDRDRVQTNASNTMSNVPLHPAHVSDGGPIVPPIPPAHGTDVASSGSELYTTASGRQRHRHHLGEAAIPAAAGAGLAGGALAAESSRRRQSGANTNSIESTPVSVRVKMHNDGRHVTLRRLTEEEAIAQREARRHERRAAAASRRRTSSISSSSGGEALGYGAAADRRWQRTEQLERQQEMHSQHSGSVTPAHYPTPPPPGTQAVDPRTGQTYRVPAPPPIPGSSSNINPTSSLTSPGTDDASGTTDYANNRRRRRAERAQARMAREGRNQNTVDFT